RTSREGYAQTDRSLLRDGLQTGERLREPEREFGAGMSIRPGAGDPETQNPKPETSSGPRSPVPDPCQAMGLTAQLPFDETARLDEFRRRMAGRLDDYDELKLCALELKHYGM